MIISPTERPMYKRCRRQWYVNSRNRLGMTRIVSPGPLALGTMIHDTLGLWLDMYKVGQELPGGGLAMLFVQYADRAIKEARAVYERQVGIAMSESELAPLYESVTLGHAMMNNYQERWKQPVPNGFEVVTTEQRCTVPIPGTEHLEEWVWKQAADPSTAAGAEAMFTPGVGWLVKQTYSVPQLHYLQCRLDGVLREKKTGRLYVLEHKSYGQRPREDVLFSQDQFLAYHWVLLQLANEMGVSLADVAGVAYDGLWKRASPPKMVDGHKGSIADLFVRRLITRPVQELIEFEDELRQEVFEMASNPAIYKNRTGDGSCFWGCADNQLCLAMSRGEDYDHILRTQYKRKDELDAVTEVDTAV